MKRPETFPFEYRAGGMIFQVYLAPVTKKLKDGTEKQYESFQVYHQQGAEPVTTRRANWAKVEAYIEEVVAAARANDPERLELSGRDRRVYLAAAEAASKAGIEVDAAVREYAETSELLKPFGITLRAGAQMLADALSKLKETSAALSTAVEFFNKHGAKLKIKNVPKVVEELLKELEKNKRGKYHIGNTKTRLTRFANSFPGPIDDVFEKDISAWLQGLVKIVWKNGERVPHPKGELVGDRTRNNYRDAVNELFNFARLRGYLMKDVETQASATVRLEVDPGTNHIIYPPETATALESLSPHLVPFAVLKLFCGVRTEEGCAISWEEVKIKLQTLVVEGAISKLGQRRAPALQKNALKWLKPFASLTGPVNPRYSSSQALYKAVKREFAKAGVVLKRNTFRNCYISFRYAQPTDSGIVADEAGTSKRMVEKNYKALATKQEAKRWFSIEPSKKKLKELKQYVAQLKSQKAEGNA